MSNSQQGMMGNSQQGMVRNSQQGMVGNSQQGMVLKVSPPKLGESIPAQVVAEITIDLRCCGDKIRKEWNEVGEFDNLFLVAVDGTAMEGRLPPKILRLDTKTVRNVFLMKKTLRFHEDLGSFL